MGPRGRGGASIAQTFGPRPLCSQHWRRGGTESPAVPQPPAGTCGTYLPCGPAGVCIPPSLPGDPSLPRLRADGWKSLLGPLKGEADGLPPAW